MGFFHIWLWLCMMLLTFVHNVAYIASLFPFIAKHYVIAKYTTFQCIDQLRGVFVCFFFLSKLQLSWIKCQWMFECKSLCVHIIWFILNKPRNSLLQLYGRFVHLYKIPAVFQSCTSWLFQQQCKRILVILYFCFCLVFLKLVSLVLREWQ